MYGISYHILHICCNGMGIRYARVCTVCVYHINHHLIPQDCFGHSNIQYQPDVTDPSHDWYVSVWLTDPSIDWYVSLSG